jgi:uncharacterized protein RhaS with RHS repeats
MYYRARYYHPKAKRFIAEDPIGQNAGPIVYAYVEGDPIDYVDPLGLFDLPALPQGFVDFSAGLGDALLLVTGGYLRDAMGIGGVDACSDTYKYGGWASFAAGGLRLGYAAAAKGISLAASSGAAASAGRQNLKVVFRGGFGRNWRKPNLAGKTDAELRASAGKTNPGINAYGAGVAAAGAYGGAGCGCP